MITHYKKRDGSIDTFRPEKISSAIARAFEAAGEGSQIVAEKIANMVTEKINSEKISIPDVEHIQDLVEEALSESGYVETTLKYALYREKHRERRETKIDLMDSIKDLLEINPRIGVVRPALRMLQMWSSASQKYYLEKFLPQDVANAHINGRIHIHALDYFTISPDSFFVPAEKILKNGFYVGDIYIRPPRRLSSAVQVLMRSVYASQGEFFGEIVINDFDKVLAPYVDDLDEAKQETEGFLFSINTIYAKAGAQTSFVTVSIGRDTSENGRIVAKALLESSINMPGYFFNPTIMFYVKRGVNLDENDPNRDLLDLAILADRKKMNVTFVLEDDAFYNGANMRIKTPAGSGHIGCVSIDMDNVYVADNTDEAIELSVSALDLKMSAMMALNQDEFPISIQQGLFEGGFKNGTLLLGVKNVKTVEDMIMINNLLKEKNISGNTIEPYYINSGPHYMECDTDAQSKLHELTPGGHLSIVDANENEIETIKSSIKSKLTIITFNRSGMYNNRQWFHRQSYLSAEDI